MTLKEAAEVILNLDVIVGLLITVIVISLVFYGLWVPNIKPRHVVIAAISGVITTFIMYQMGLKL